MSKKHYIASAGLQAATGHTLGSLLTPAPKAEELADAAWAQHRPNVMEAIMSYRWGFEHHVGLIEARDAIYAARERARPS